MITTPNCTECPDIRPDGWDADELHAVEHSNQHHDNQPSDTDPDGIDTEDTGDNFGDPNDYDDDSHTYNTPDGGWTAAPAIDYGNLPHHI